MGARSLNCWNYTFLQRNTFMLQLMTFFFFQVKTHFAAGGNQTRAGAGVGVSREKQGERNVSWMRFVTHICQDSHMEQSLQNSGMRICMHPVLQSSLNFARTCLNRRSSRYSRALCGKRSFTARSQTRFTISDLTPVPRQGLCQILHD